jgi:nicotinate-nucleotide adenylyltransferase
VDRVLLFGGTFDPPHHGHLIPARAAAELLGIDRVILLPTRHPPHKPLDELTPADERVEMCRLAVDGEPGFEVSEYELSAETPNYTIRTVRHFQETLGADVHLYWLLGVDNLNELADWHQPQELASACTLVTTRRPGIPAQDLAELRRFLRAELVDRIERHMLETPLIGISARAIRQRVRAGLSVRYLIPDPVRAFIDSRGLYRDKAR